MSTPTLRLMRAKLHRVVVTHARQHYIGSITVDAALMELVGLLPLEEVDVVNVDNGQRWSTYVLPGERGSGTVAPNGGGALLCEPGQRLIIFAYAERSLDELRTQGHSAHVLVADAHNGVQQLMKQALVPGPDGFTFRSDDPVVDADFCPELRLRSIPELG